MAMVF